MNNILLKCNNVDFYYRDDQILNSVNLDIKEGDFICIIGPNGAGKSTLLKILCGILSPKKGEILIKGKKLSEYSRRKLSAIITYVPQETAILFPYTVNEIVLMGRSPYLSVFQSETETDITIVEEAMKEAKVWEFKDRYFNQLSTGEKQRVILASALAQEPEILLLDEPTSNMDPKYKRMFMNILKKLDYKKTVIFVSHDLNLALNNFKNLILLKNGSIACKGNTDEILKENILSNVFETSFIIDKNDNRILISPEYVE